MNPNEKDYADQFDGGAPTEEEQKLIDAGLEDEGDADDAAGNADAEAAAEAARVAEQAARQAADDAAAQAAAQVQTAEPPAKPEPPKDFAAELAAIEDAYEAGDLTNLELNKKMRELTLEEVEYKNVLAEWQRQHDAITAANAKAIEDDWNAPALAFEKDHADFLSNDLRKEVMQRAIAQVEKNAQAAGERLSSVDLLRKAYAMAKDYCGYTEPTPDPNAGKDKIREAINGRKPPNAPVTLGDMPTSHTESRRGNETFADLDALSTPELEVAFANMSPAQQEAFLRDAPGATANGRD